MIDRGSLRAPELHSLAGVLAAVTAYSVLHVGARLLASGNLGEDDPLSVVFIQDLRLGYLPDQPALYDWVMWLIEKLTGPTVVGFQVLKYALLTATCGFIFLAARRVMKGDALWAFLCVESLALIYQISWRFHEGFTHQVGAMAAIAAAFWALLRIIEERRAADYALFGVFAGLAMLSEQAALVAIATMLIAMSLQPAIRGALFSPAMLASVGVAALVASPYVWWLLAEPGRLAAALPLPSMPIGERFSPALEGLLRAFTEPLMYLAPLIFIYPLLFPRMLPQTLREFVLKARADAPADLELLIAHMALLGVGALIVGALFLGLTRYPTHDIMPIFLISAIWLAARARRAMRGEMELRRLVTLALVIAMVAFGGRLANMYVLDPVCKICRWGTPHDGLARILLDERLGNAAIVVADNDLGGNLRRFMPDAPIILAAKHVFVPAAASQGHDQAVLLWETQARASRLLERFQQIAPGLSAQDMARATVVSVPWTGHLWRADGNRSTSWSFLKMPASALDLRPR